MKRNQRIIQFTVALLSALLLLLLWGTAVAQNGNGKDIVRFGSDVTIAEQQVVNNATAIAGSVIVLKNGQVMGDAVAVGGDVILKSGARVTGDVTAVGGDILREENVTVSGDSVVVMGAERGMMHRMRQWGLMGLLTRAYLFSAVVHVLVVLAIAAIGLLLVLLVPQLLQTIASTINQDPLQSGAWGFGGAVVLILLSALISGSMLGLLLLPVVNLVALAAGLLGTLGIGVWLGQRTLSASGQPLWQQLLIGMLILGVVGLIPVVGGLFFLVANLFGFGGVLVSQLSNNRLERFRQRTDQSQQRELMDTHQSTDTHPQEMS